MKAEDIEDHPTRHILLGLPPEIIEDFHMAMEVDADRVEQQLMGVHLADDEFERLEAASQILSHMDSTCRTVFMDTLLQYVDSINDIVKAIICERIPLNQRVTDLLIVMIDILRMSANEIFEDNVVNTDMLEVFIDCNETLANLQASEIQGEVLQLYPQYTAARSSGQPSH